MKFRTKIKMVKKLNKIKLKIRDLLHKKPFYIHLYKRIQDEFIFNNKTCIRYYMDANTLRDESFKIELQLYHKAYGTYFNLYNLEEVFNYTKNYISDRLSKYNDLQFICGEDDHGLYFEIGYQDGY